MEIKFKLLVYNLIGLGLTSLLPIIFTYKMYFAIMVEKQSTYTLIGNFIGIVFFDFVIIVLMMFLFMVIDAIFKDDVTVLGYYDYISCFRRSKVVNHSKLGKFLLVCEENRMSIYEVNWLYFRFIDHFYVNGRPDIEYVKTNINIILDNEYERQVEVKKDKDWDGYLDLEGKRDDRINKILK